MERFEGRVALVTGVSAGIGARIAEDLVKAGLVVVGVARRQQRLEELAARLAGEKGKLHPVVADLSRPEEVRRVYEWLDANLGGVTVVVNNAAMLTLTPMQDLDADTIPQLVDTNLTGVMLSCREAVLNMKKHGTADGHIININSDSGHKIDNIRPYSMSAYSATKFGVTALSRGLRFDVQQMEGFKIRVTSISPGTVQTEMLPKEILDRMEESTDYLKPKDISDAVLYALSCPPGVEITELTIKPIGQRS